MIYGMALFLGYTDIDRMVEKASFFCTPILL